LNNLVPNSTLRPGVKLCAWTGIWREMLRQGMAKVDSLVVVAGGDCHNALVDGQKTGHQRTHFFFYPFQGDTGYLEEQLEALADFLGGLRDLGAFRLVRRVKELGMELEKRRLEGRIPGHLAFKLLVSFSDLDGDPLRFQERLKEAIEQTSETQEGIRVALVGVPPIYHDFHEAAQRAGLEVVFDELPYEFLRHTGTSLGEIARSYSGYTFARQLDFRLDFLERELERRRIDGVVHYTQFACHHLLEDEVLRERLDYPVLTVQGDMPGATPAQVLLRLEAFREMLERQP